MLRAVILALLVAAAHGITVASPSCESYNNDLGVVDIGQESYNACEKRSDCAFVTVIIGGDMAFLSCRTKTCSHIQSSDECKLSALGCTFNTDANVCVASGEKVPCEALRTAAACAKYPHCASYRKTMADGTVAFRCQVPDSPPPCELASTKKNCASLKDCYWRVRTDTGEMLSPVCTADPTVLQCGPRGNSTCKEVGCAFKGKCPKASGMGTCVEACTASSCPAGEGCCSNGCGHTCQKLVQTCEPPARSCADLRCPAGTACDPFSSPARCSKCVKYSFCNSPRCGTAKEYLDYAAFPPMCPESSDSILPMLSCGPEPFPDGTCGFSCGGIAGLPCPVGQECVDVEGDGCNPLNGGADCPGRCAACPADKVFQECGSACPPTCANTNPEMCIAVCVSGCFCPAGTVETADGKCVAPAECPAECPKERMCKGANEDHCCAADEACVYDDDAQVGTCVKPNMCCDPLKEPGKFGNAMMMDGHACCPTTGEWVGNIGDGLTWTCPGRPNGPFAELCVCCDPLKEPGTNGVPPMRDGHACCPLTGEWVSSIGDGKTFGNCPGYETGPFGSTCPNLCCNPLTEPGKFGNPPAREGYVCCPTTGEWALSFGDATHYACPGRQTGPFGKRCAACPTERAALLAYAKQCVRSRPNAQMCGGIAGLRCPAGQTCFDDPRDSCNPATGADCAGVCCAEPGPRSVPMSSCLMSSPPACGGFAGLACKANNTQCVDDPRDDCDPANGGADCMGICCCQGNVCPAPEGSCTKKCTARGLFWNGAYEKDDNNCDRTCACDPCPAVTQESCSKKCASNAQKPYGVLVGSLINGVKCAKCMCRATKPNV